MKIIIDQMKVSLKSRVANLLAVFGLLALLIAVLLPYFVAHAETIASTLLLAGLITSLLGIVLANRWVRKPRPETVLDDELKDLTDAHRLYHYQHKAGDHILLAPNGVTVIETVAIEGRFTYTNGRWREFMKLGRALRYIFEEHLGDPTRAAVSSCQYLKKQLHQAVEGGENVPVTGVVAFTHPRMALEIEGSTPVPAVAARDLKKIITKNTTRMPSELYQRVQKYLDKK